VRNTLSFISRLVYVLATLVLIALAFGFIGYAGWSIYVTMRGGEPVLTTMLDTIGLIIIALAVSDVARFLLQEELAGQGELETTGDVRRTISKFVTIIIIAASLEALVFIFEAGREEIRTLIYPVALLLAVSILLAVLGLYQRLAHAAEHERRIDAERGLKTDPEREEVEEDAQS
jgi:hypothetical protein